MSLVSILLALAASPIQNPSPPKAALPPAVAQRPARDSTIVRVWKVLDSLIAVPLPRSLIGAQATTWSEQTAWFKDLKARIENLLALVVAPAKTVAPPAPIDPKNIKALQDEAQLESRRFALASGALKARHDVAMNAIRNMK